MSNTIFSCSVWCEVHGPVNIFCTQTAASETVPSPTNARGVATPLHPPMPSSPAQKGTCASCSLSLPAHLVTPGVAPCLKTKHGDVTYLSLRHPTSQDRYKAIRSACIRALSCELVPGRTGPVFFGDPSIGYTIAYIFRLADVTSAPANTHDGRRQYALMCTTTEEQDLLQAWTFITERFRVLVQKITDGGKAMADRHTSALGHQGGPSDTVSMDKDRTFLRPKGRAAEKGLAELVGMDDIFVQLHAAFGWMLGIWRTHFEGANRTQMVSGGPIHNTTVSEQNGPTDEERLTT